MPRPAAPTRSPVQPDTAWTSINTLRVLAMDAVEQANSGHPGTPMALAPVAYLLWTRHLKHNPGNPDWADRDRFVLSCGHASMLLYGLLHLTGYDLPLDEIRNFRQWGSRTPGHPERGHTAGVETTTGPLGQGMGNAVGMAIAERFLAASFNRPGQALVDHRTWVIASDGDLMEGVASEAASLAGHLRLGKLAVVYDDNRITIDGRTDLAFSEDVGLRFEGYGWRVLRVDDGNDLAAIDAALSDAAGQAERPTLIVLRTIIADPAPTKRDTSAAHGAPLGADEIRKTKAILGWPDEPFFVPDSARKDMGAVAARGAEAEAAWQRLQAAYAGSHPADAERFRQWRTGDLPAGWDAGLPAFPADAKGVETRKASAAALKALAASLPNLVGGSADLAGSTGTTHGLGGEFGPQSTGQTIHWGIREHGMAACLNGMAAHGGLRPFGSTFLVFSDYMKPSIRLAAIMGLPVIYLGTHDSIGVGEDGPTHQPVEHLAMLRAIPNLVVLRPGDANETVEAWRVAVARREGPTLLALTRQRVPVLDRAVLASAEGVRRGGYVLFDPPAAEAIVMATGSELSVALAAAEQLTTGGLPVRVVSLPSWELFAAQPQAYRDAVLPPALRARVSVEAATSFGWHRWLGDRGEAVSLDHFGASAPGERLFEEFGFTTSRVADAIRRVHSRPE
ncbi:MAG TPA: transketolase [Gemmatimonadales bacterium]|nr:transketolase [Gemmatimonadales bacterium]